jgi:Protein of unknown function (DUF2905)
MGPTPPEAPLGAPAVGRLLMVLGAVFLGAGALLHFAPRIPLLGRLPGDFAIERGNWTFYFPLGTCLLLSLLLTLVFWIISALCR